MKLAIYINKNKKNLEDILNIVIKEFSSQDDEIIYLNEEKFISGMKKWKKDKKPKKEEPFKKNSKYGLLALFLQDWERRIVGYLWG